MKLYLLEPVEYLHEGDDPWDPWFDKVFGFVVRADTEENARRLANEQAGDENRGEFMNQTIAQTKTPWLEEKYSTCVEINSYGKEEVILRDLRSA